MRMDGPSNCWKIRIFRNLVESERSPRCLRFFLEKLVIYQLAMILVGKNFQLVLEVSPPDHDGIHQIIMWCDKTLNFVSRF